MADKVLDIINRRNEFLKLLDQDIYKNTEIYQEISKCLKRTEDTCEHIKELGQKPEHNALIPLCKNLYIPGRIIHTGEYLVTAPAHPNSYSILKTLDQTINSLEKQIQDQRKLLEKAESAKIQLQERKNLLYGQVDGIVDNIDEVKSLDKLYLDSDDDDEENEEERRQEVSLLPKEIYSDKGVALKVGEFFEILEYEES